MQKPQNNAPEILIETHGTPFSGSISTKENFSLGHDFTMHVHHMYIEYMH